MKLAFIELAGFRGFRERVRIDFPDGFAVITGRNGVGKSTICDAVEFALTGGVRKFTESESPSDRFADYLWWRTDSHAAADQYVSVGFTIGDDGPPRVFTRRRDGQEIPTERDIRELLCDAATAPADAVSELVQTTILRDELTARLRLDLSDSAGASFAASALGLRQIETYRTKAARAAEYLRGQEDDARRGYEAARDRLNRTLADLSAAQSAALEGDAASAGEVLDQLLPDRPSSLRDSLDAARDELARRLVVLRELRELSTDVFLLNREAEDARAAGVAGELEDLERELRKVEVRMIDLEPRVEEARERALLRRSLEIVREHVRVSGAETCPVCGTVIDGVLHALPPSADDQSAGDDKRSVRKRFGRLEERHYELVKQIDALTAQKRHDQARIDAITRREDTIIDKAAKLGVTLARPLSLEPIEDTYGRISDGTLKLEHAVGILERSARVARANELADAAADQRAQVVAAESHLTTCRNARRALADAQAAVERAGSEFIEERLSSMQHVLNELYQRLRPHTRFRTVRYRLSGDVRRLLRLSVGEGEVLDPEFLFSTGQRRAAGLAFLLALHLARRWARWETVILDDPIQHIDDFRALHVIEVLSALRLQGRQIVVAVEDAGVADALCRRLRSSFASPGVRIELGLSRTGIPEVKARTPVVPLRDRVLGATVAGV